MGRVKGTSSPSFHGKASLAGFQTPNSFHPIELYPRSDWQGGRPTVAIGGSIPCATFSPLHSSRSLYPHKHKLAKWEAVRSIAVTLSQPIRIKRPRPSGQCSTSASLPSKSAAIFHHSDVNEIAICLASKLRRETKWPSCFEPRSSFLHSAFSACRTPTRNKSSDCIRTPKPWTRTDHNE